MAKRLRRSRRRKSRTSNVVSKKIRTVTAPPLVNYYRQYRAVARKQRRRTSTPLIGLHKRTNTTTSGSSQRSWASTLVNPQEKKQSRQPGRSASLRARRNCKPRPDRTGKKLKSGGGSSRSFVPWC